MPIYEYQCKDCGEVFEKVVSFTEAAKMPVCPECASSNTHKQLSSIAAFGNSSSGGSSSTSNSCAPRGGFG
jgi:putative FmdB family regulatory protein